MVNWVVELKEHPVEYNGYGEGGKYWKYGESKMTSGGVLGRVMSGMQSSISLAVISSMKDYQGHPIPAMQFQEEFYDRVGSSEERVQNLYLLYALLVK